MAGHITDCQTFNVNGTPIYDVFLCRFDAASLQSDQMVIPADFPMHGFSGVCACVIAPYYARIELTGLRLVTRVPGQAVQPRTGILLQCPYYTTYAMVFPLEENPEGPLVAWLEKPGWTSPQFVLEYRAQTLPGHLAIATLAKFDSPYINEWIEYHAYLGVEHFYIYTNSEPALADYLAPEVERGRVTVMPWDYPYIKYPPEWYPLVPRDCVFYTQGPQQTHAVRAFGHLWQWIAAMDADEFLVPSCGSVADYLRSLPDDVDSVEVTGKWFGTAGYGDVKSDVVETYCRAEKGYTSFPKTINRPQSVQSVLIHWAAIETGSLREDPSVLRFNHYRSISDHHSRRGPEYDREYTNEVEECAARDLFRVKRASALSP